MEKFLIERKKTNFGKRKQNLDTNNDVLPRQQVWVETTLQPHSTPPSGSSLYPVVPKLGRDQCCLVYFLGQHKRDA